MTDWIVICPKKIKGTSVIRRRNEGYFYGNSRYSVFFHLPKNPYSVLSLSPPFPNPKDRENCRASKRGRERERENQISIEIHYREKSINSIKKGENISYLQC